MLVRPFIQPISAFNANAQNGIANVCVLGGDIITTVNYQIYQSDTLVYSGSMPVTDNGGSAIRTFQIILTQSMGLVNNGSYTIRAWTVNATETSGYSSVALFYCYTTPTITLKDTNNTTITSSYVFTAQSGTLNVDFAKNDNDSIATLNTFSMNIFGVDSNGNLNLVYSSGDVYTPFAVAYDNLTPTNTVSPLYASYQIQWVAETTQGMNLGGSIIGLACNYTITESGNLISVENDSANGRIAVRLQLDYFGSAIANPISQRGVLLGACQDENIIYLCGSGRTSSSDPLLASIVLFNKQSNTFGSLKRESTYAGSAFMSMAYDENNIYCGGNAGSGRPLFVVYNKTSGSFGSPIQVPNAETYYFQISKVVQDDNYVYCACSGVAATYFCVYEKQSGQFVHFSELPFDNFYDMVYADSTIYVSVGGANEMGVENGTYKYNWANTTYEKVFYDVDTMVVDGNNIYGAKSGELVVFNILTNSYSSYYAKYSRAMSISADEKYIYVGDTVGNIWAYDKNGYSFVKEIGTNLNYAVRGILIDSGKVYCCMGSSYIGAGIPNVDGAFIFMETYSIDVRRKDITSNGNNYVTLISSTNITLPTIVSSGYAIFYDYFAKNNTLYEYDIIITRQNGTGYIETVQALSQFCKSYIADGNTAYELYEEWGVDNYQRNQKTAIYEPYGSKYPFVAYNSITNYDSGSDTAIYRAPTNKGKQYLDSVTQAKYNKQLLGFLTNRKVKVRKTESGDIALVATLNAVPNTYYKEMGNTLATTQFEWVEVGDFTDEDFKKLGITNGFTLYAQ